MDELTKEEQQLAVMMKVWAIVFGIGGVIFFLFPEKLFDSMNMTSTIIFKDTLPLLKQSSEKFWSALSLSLMTTLTFMCWLASKDIRKNGNLVKAVLVSKLASTLFYIFFFIDDSRILAYIIGSMFSDGPIFIIILVFYMRAVGSVQQKA